MLKFRNIYNYINFNFKKGAIVRFIALFLLCVFLIRFDLSTKDIVFKYIHLSDKGEYECSDNVIRRVIFPGFALVNIENYGITWGSFSDLGKKSVIFTFIGVTLESILFVIYFLLKYKLQKIAVLLMFVGGFGNIYDRIKYGYVRDFIDIYIANKHWPAFNFADVFVVSGAMLLIFWDIKEQLKKKKKLPKSRSKKV